jgi:putative phosphoribosyl transferase
MSINRAHAQMRPPSRYRDREQAGRAVAAALEHLRGRDVVVLALPRGGVPVGAEVARELRAPLDVFVVRKLGVPGYEELAIGAIASGGVIVLNREVVEGLRLGREEIERVVARERAELRRRERAYRGERPAVEVKDRTAVLVDDGLATGSTMAAAAEALRRRDPGHLVVAAPVGSPRACRALRALADEVVCLAAPEHFRAVGEFYADFRQLSDADVRRLLAFAGEVQEGDSVDDAAREELELVLDGHSLGGQLTVPRHAGGLVVFAHGSGSSHRSPRNRQVAAALQRAALATLLFDLLDEQEARRRELVFDVELLATRLLAVTGWARGERGLLGLPIGYFGASTGAAAALLAAAELDKDVGAVVSRGGRPDLAARRLAQVRAPTLLIVGGADRQVLELNRQAAALLRCRHELAVVEGAGHLFQEPGALEEVARLAREWFVCHLTPGGSDRLS